MRFDQLNEFLRGVLDVSFRREAFGQSSRMREYELGDGLMVGNVLLHGVLDIDLDILLQILLAIQHQLHLCTHQISYFLLITANKLLDLLDLS